MSRISAQRCREDLIKIFYHQETRLLSLNAYLIDVKDRIAANDVDALNDILQQDILPVEELNELEHQRHRLLAIYGFDYEKHELEKCIAWCDIDNQVEQKYQQVNEALAQLQHSVQINDFLVNKGKSKIRRALHILTGQNKFQQSVTYTHSGEAQDSAENRSLARA